MALTQSQWFEKLKTFVPPWMFEQQDLNVAVFQAIAKLLAERQASNEEKVAETFILSSTEFLDLHGDERSVPRISGEPDVPYRERIRYIQNSIALNTLYPAVLGLMANDLPIFIENWAYGFADDELFADCDDSIYISKTKQYNRFTLLIPAQAGTEEDLALFRSLLVEVLDENKALGVFYDVLLEFEQELTAENGDNLTTEDGDDLMGEAN